MCILELCHGHKKECFPKRVQLLQPQLWDKLLGQHPSSLKSEAQSNPGYNLKTICSDKTGLNHPNNSQMWEETIIERVCYTTDANVYVSSLKFYNMTVDFLSYSYEDIQLRHYQQSRLPWLFSRNNHFWLFIYCVHLYLNCNGYGPVFRQNKTTYLLHHCSEDFANQQKNSIVKSYT